MASLAKEVYHKQQLQKVFMYYNIGLKLMYHPAAQNDKRNGHSRETHHKVRDENHGEEKHC